MTEIENARAETIQEVSYEILKAAGRVMQRHGDDPECLIVLAAGFTMALQSIGTNIDCIVPSIVVQALQPR
jgi:hypothetical protein